MTISFKILKQESGDHTLGIIVFNDSYGSEETMELDVQGITPELQQLLTPIMIQAGADIIKSMLIYVVREHNRL